MIKYRGKCADTWRKADFGSIVLNSLCWWD